LVSNSDVENYKQIKTDLDELRLLVEKSELWVYKSKKDSVSASPGKDKKKKDKKEKKKDTIDEVNKKDSSKQDSDKNGREDSDSDEVTIDNSNHNNSKTFAGFLFSEKLSSIPKLTKIYCILVFCEALKWLSVSLYVDMASTNLMH
jgi:hypothetical protein